jgi:hypothetical protein
VLKSRLVAREPPGQVYENIDLAVVGHHVLDQPADLRLIGKIRDQREYPGPGRLQLIGAGRHLVLTARHDPEQRTVFRNGPRHRLPDLPVSAHSGYERHLSFQYACHLNALFLSSSSSRSTSPVAMQLDPNDYDMRGHTSQPLDSQFMDRW